MRQSIPLRVHISAGIDEATNKVAVCSKRCIIKRPISPVVFDIWVGSHFQQEI